MTISAVNQNQQFVVGTDQITDHRFHDKSTAALQRHADMIFAAVNQRQQMFADLPVYRYEIGIARTIIMQHRLLDGL